MNGNYDRPMIPARRNMPNTSNAGGNMGNSSSSNNSNNNSSSSSNQVPDITANTSNMDNMNWLEEQIREHPEFRTPPQQTFDTEEMEGSIQKILAENIGAYVVVEFLIGTDRITRKQGYLYHVGTSYITLYDDENENFILCDIFSVKFVYFYIPGQRPNRNFNMLPHNNGNSG
ncbi:MAG: hypothetical protein K2G04_02900 [Oscillospiraceae bacterium]|nr:hypothetical protein [Oscillospiraceae bacterium]